MRDVWWMVGIIVTLVVVCSLMGHADAMAHCQSIATVIRIAGACYEH